MFSLNLSALLLLAALAGVIMLFWHGHGRREQALRATRRRCRREQVQLLDQTVSLVRRRLQRDQRWNFRLIRIYGFEFTVTGSERYRGETTLQGDRIESVWLEPHRLPGQDELSR